MPARICDPPNHCELWKQLERHAGRLSVVESRLKALEEGMQTWSGIVRDGFADVSMEVNVMKQANSVMQQAHSQRIDEDASKIVGRLSSIEGQLQEMQTKVNEGYEFALRVSRVESLFKDLQVSLRDMKPLPETQNIHKEQHQCINAVGEICLEPKESSKLGSKNGLTLGVGAPLLSSSATSPLQVGRTPVLANSLGRAHLSCASLPASLMAPPRKPLIQPQPETQQCRRSVSLDRRQALPTSWNVRQTVHHVPQMQGELRNGMRHGVSREPTVLLSSKQHSAGRALGAPSADAPTHPCSCPLQHRELTGLIH